MNAKFALGAALALLSLTAAAFGQTPAILGPAPDPRAPLSMQERLSMQEPRIPRGTPGFYDPSTRTFAPLVNESPAAAFPDFSGTVAMDVHFLFSQDVKADDKVTCELRMEFVTGTPLLDATESKDMSFRADSSERLISNHFCFVQGFPSPSPLIEIHLSCFVRSGAFGEAFHFDKITNFVDAGNGLLRISVTMNL
jgi:hypothetical protein